MKVVVDVLGAPAQSGGMRLYAEEVVRSWVTVAPQDRLLVLGDAWVRDAFAHLPGVAVRCVPSRNPLARSLGQLLAAPFAYWTSGADAVLSLSPVVTPLVPRRARTCVVHDWRHVKNPHEFSRAQRAYRTLWRRSVRWAGHVATISVKTERETQELVPGARTSVVENGRDHARRWDVHVPGPRPDGERTVVTFGHHPNKRPELVIDAVAALTPARQRSTVLVVLGARGDHARALRARAARAGLLAELHLPGFVPAAEYERLVATAGVVVLASSDEGFGLPVTEAEYFGVPVVGTTDSGLAEVHAGSALRVVEPRSEDLARELEAALARPPAPAPPTTRRSWDDVAVDLRALTAPHPSRRNPVVALGTLVGLLPAGPAKNTLARFVPRCRGGA